MLQFKPSMLIFIVFLASIFRLSNLRLIEFKYDEAINLFLASRPLFGHQIPPGSTVSSVGILNPPLINYLLFPFALISLDPKIISYIIAFLNVLAIGGFFLILKKYYGRLIALTACSLLALSPWMILFSRKIWAQDFIFPLMVPFFYSLHQIVLEKKDKYWAVYSLFALFLFQLHQSTVFFLLPLSLLLILRSKISFRYLLLGAFLGLLPLVPYLSYITRNLNSDPQAFLVNKERFSQIYHPVIFLRLLQLPNQGNFYFVWGEDIIDFARDFSLAFNLRRIFYLEYLLIPLGLFVLLKKYPKIRFIGFSTVLLPIIYFLFHIEPFVHYFLIISPFLFLYLALGFQALIKHRHKYIRTIGIISLVMILASSIIFDCSFFRYLKEKGGLRGDYGSIFNRTERQSKKNFSQYCCGKDYQEMILTSYLQRNLFFGTLPLGKMIYPPSQTEKMLSQLEEEIKVRPDDPRLHLELISFFTQEKNPQTVISLEQRLKEKPGLKIVFEEVSRFNRE